MLSEKTLSSNVAGTSSRIATAVFAASFGAFLLYFTAFSHSQMLHDAAHDTRHAITAPCH
ncbi:MAG: CbtB domain-containing protein [Rhizobiaceae bacterium]